jgi:hypothetical protein
MAARAPLPEILRACAGDDGSDAMRRAAETIAPALEQGDSLATAMDRHPSVFPAGYRRLVRLGERSSTLPAMMNRLADRMENRLRFGEAFRKAKETTILTAGGGGDGKIETHYDYDVNGILDTLTDDNGNRTVWTFDSQNRQIGETKGIVVSPSLADRDDADTTIVWTYSEDGSLEQSVSVSGCFGDIHEKLRSRVNGGYPFAPGGVRRRRRG